MPEPITLSALAPERQIVRIEVEKDVFEEYEMAVADDLSLIQRRELAHTWQQLNQLEDKIELTKNDDLQFDRLSKKLVGLVLPGLPRELRDAMPRGTREGIFIAFFGNPSDPRLRAMMQMIENQIEKQTGDTTSLDSNDSTEEIQSDGSTSQLDSSDSI